MSSQTELLPTSVSGVDCHQEDPRQEAPSPKPPPHWSSGMVRVFHQFIRHSWRCMTWLWRVLDKIHRWIIRTLLLKTRAFLTGVGAFFCLMVFAWIVTPIPEPLPVAVLVLFSLGGGIVVLIGHRYYSRFRAVERFMDWLERKGRQRKEARVLNGSAADVTPSGSDEIAKNGGRDR